MEIEYLPSGPGLLITDERRILAVADIHMGIESDLQISRLSSAEQGKGTDRTCDGYGIGLGSDIILLLGDIKHRVPGISWQEFREIPDLFSDLRKKTSILVTPGKS